MQFLNSSQNIPHIILPKFLVIKTYVGILLILNQAPGHVLNKVPLWSWECLNDKCVPIKARMNGKMQSLMTCNMLCGSMYLWPQPTGHVSLSTTAVPVRADLYHLNIISIPSRPVREHIKEAFENFIEVLRKMEYETRTFEEWRAVDVRIAMNESASADPRLRLDTDESYKLSIKPKNSSRSLLYVNIFANSFCGVRHALETLSQLIWPDSYAGSLIMLEAAQVHDAPRFKYRGLLLDTARNFFPISDLIRTIDAMSACKLNTFHWHITDSQSFPLQATSFPQLSQFGAYGVGAVYTADDIRTVARHARVRGIRVLLEVDVPAHVGSAWNWGNNSKFDNLIYCLDSSPWSAYCKDPPCGQLNPHSLNVYDIIEGLYAEIIQLTGVDDIFHIGNDDISLRCWGEYFNETDPIDLWIEFTKNVLQRLESANGQLPDLTIMWSSHLNDRIKLDFKNYVHKLGLQTRDVAWTQKYVSGIRSIISHEDAWDFNNGLGNWYDDSGGLYNSWQRVYEHRPWARNKINLMEGGEATVWSTTLGADGLDSRIWPRAAALGERLWSDRAEGATRPVHARLDVQRTRLKNRGVQITPLWSLWCTHNPYTC